MEQSLTNDDILEFQKLISFPVFNYMTGFQSFITQDAPNIIAYYNGSVVALSQVSNRNLTTLIQQSQSLFMSITLNKSSLKNYKWWVLIESLEQMDTLLLKFSKISKWLRSSITTVNYNPNPTISIKFNQGQTLESVERDILGDPNWDNDWVDLALQNNLREEDYTTDAGFLLQANFNYTAKSLRFNSIVDNPIGDKVLGTDLSAKLELDSALQDFTVLSPQDTFRQTVGILISLRKGDNPEFPTEGITPGLVVGSNINSLSYPALFRQLVSVFKTDDTIKTFTLVGIRREQDAVFIDFQVTSRLGDLTEQTLSL